MVFDGYKDGPSTKDMTLMRRSEKCSQRLIVFTENTKFTVSKEDFLSNLSNKDQLLHLMGEKLKQEGCEVIFAEEDADVQIAKSSVDASLTKNVTLIGEDTDLSCTFEVTSRTRKKKISSMTSTTTEELWERNFALIYSSFMLFLVATPPPSFAVSERAQRLIYLSETLTNEN